MKKVENKTYTFNGEVFTTEKNVLKIQRAYQILRIHLSSLVKLYTEGIDTSVLKGYEKRVNDIVKTRDAIDKSDLVKLQDELEKFQDAGNEQGVKGTEQQIKDVEDAIERNKADIDKINEEFRNDEVALSQQAEYTQAIGNAMTMLKCSDLIPNFLESYLKGDTSKLDYENPEMIEFINSVMEDFFFLMLKSKEK